jgi:cation-transporting P-type ATPase 13A2
MLDGQCIVNEAMLTGESIPVVKTAIPFDEQEVYDPLSAAHSKYTCYAGTSVLQVKPRHIQNVLYQSNSLSH